MTYPWQYLTLLRETCLVIMDDNTMLLAFVVMNAIPNSIFSPIAPIGAMEEIMVSHPGLIPIPILLSIPIMIKNQIQM